MKRKIFELKGRIVEKVQEKSWNTGMHNTDHYRTSWTVEMSWNAETHPQHAQVAISYVDVVCIYTVV